ncbi:MAG: hydrogenase maturation protease [Ignavibacteriales bacterium]|nr:hydrogenase maturation protease [Ignavibacteriales bacterium]
MAIGKTLVIGYGNTVRTDDGAGIWIAEKLSSFQISGVVVTTTHQLSLDLLEEFKSYARVVFIDASVEGDPVQFDSVGKPAVPVPPSAHHCTPADLVSTYSQLYGGSIEGYFCTVRGENFEFGTELTAATVQHASSAVEMLEKFLWG